jgi:hypothetical protein
VQTEYARRPPGARSSKALRISALWSLESCLIWFRVSLATLSGDLLAIPSELQGASSSTLGNWMEEARRLPSSLTTTTLVILSLSTLDLRAPILS